MDRDKIFEKNKNLVYYVVNKYFASCRDKNDMIQEGFVGLLRAIDTFDKDYGVQFQTYATRCIINSVNDFVRRNKTISTRSAKNNVEVISMYATISEGDNKSIMLGDTLSGKDYIKEFELWDTITSYVNSIRDKKQKQVFLMFLNNKRLYGQAKEREIRSKCKISRTTMYRIIKENLNRLEKEIEWRN